MSLCFAETIDAVNNLIKELAENEEVMPLMLWLEKR